MKWKMKTTMILIFLPMVAASIFIYADYAHWHQKNLVVIMQSSRLAFAQVFFDAGKGYNEADSYAVLTSYQSLHAYVFPLTSKSIKSLRFDPADGSSLVRIKAVWIENHSGDIIRKIPLQDFVPVHQIRAIFIDNGMLVIEPSENANDPVLYIQNSSINHSLSWIDYLMIRGRIIVCFGLIVFLILATMAFMLKIMEEHFHKTKNIFVGIRNMFIILLSVLVVVHWWHYIHTYSVNILFWDQWDFYTPLFNNESLWKLFSWQHGPHRMGVGLILAKWIAQHSSWNTRVEAFAIGGVVFLAMLIALWLRYKLTRRLGWPDLAIPLLFLTPLQFEIFAGTPNISHGAMPLLMLMLYCVVWVSCRGLWRYTAVLMLNFMLIYTGFGIFVGLITPGLFCLEAFRAHRFHDQRTFWISLISLAVSLVSLGSFFVGYHFSPAIEGFKFPIPEWWRYFQFVALMLAGFCGIKGTTLLAYGVGFSILFVIVASTIFHGIKMLRSKDVNGKSSSSNVIFVLTMFTLLFCVNAAIGRILLGLQSAQASRYITLMIPGFFGIYLWLLSWPSGLVRRVLLIISIIGLIVTSVPLPKSDAKELTWSSSRKIRWKRVYLCTESIDTANRAAGFPIHPTPEQTHLRQKLNYLKQQKLNLYLDVNERDSSMQQDS